MNLLRRLIQEKRGSLYVEALIVIPLFLIIWGVLNHFLDHYRESIVLRQRVRACVMAFSLGGCEEVPPICDGVELAAGLEISIENMSDMPDIGAIDGFTTDSVHEVADNEMQALNGGLQLATYEAPVINDVILDEDSPDKEAKANQAAQDESLMERMINRALFGKGYYTASGSGDTLGVSATSAMLCNLPPTKPLDVLIDDMIKSAVCGRSKSDGFCK